MRPFLYKEIYVHYRIQLWNAAIYIILKYGLISLEISEAMRIDMQQQFTSKCIRDIAEAGTEETLNPANLEKEHEANETISRRYGVTTLGAKIYG